MSEDKLKMYERALAREKAARKEAERILEDKSRELFYKSQELQKANIQLEKLVKEKTSELEGVFENIVDAYVVTNLLGDVLKMNEAAEALLDFTIEDKKNLMDTLHPDDYEKAAIGFQKLYKTGSLTGFNIRIVAHGNTILLELNSSIVYDENKQPIAAQGIVRDITQQKAAEQKLINSENRLSAVISNLESGILLEDENRKVVIANERFCDFFSIAITPAELIGQDCTNAAERYKHLFENEERFVTRINTLIKLKEQVVGDELQLKDGRILERDFIPIYEEGIYKGHLTTYRDVTLHRRFRKNIEAERAKYSSIIANMELGLVEVDTNDKILMVNQSLEEMSGYEEQELLGKRGRDILLDKESQQRLLEENKKRLKGTSNSYEVVAITKQGEKRHWLISGAPNYDVSGNIIGSIGIHLDITAIKELELQKESLLQKLASSNHELQEYAHVVSHDLKSPLRSLDALLTWVKEDNVDVLSSDSLENLDLMGTTLEKMEQLISDVLEYSSVSSDEKEVQDVAVSGVIDDIEKLLHIPDNICIEREDTLPTIKADRVRIQQLFQNLMSNAIRYSDKEMGIIKIGCEQSKEYNTFSVSDNGIGIEKEYHDKIFEIFQSLNKHKDSTGIGLSIVKKIVDLYSGKIWLESTPGEGTTFFFTLKKIII
ncbi:PAS domain-containing sensor histidine kinase [Dokdonia donghaensis]|uniref:histidine kinase n=1 Tax=Dokdonia donghaensis DSW-1 TaxID=1300343 RepID=A0A0A2GRR2_9FLAO|nr:PAS domain-containing sensor histidine kinase [Dokdonia donghaensis]ANH60753.1 Phytochrome-like protein cph1 [Dokdonia donghaensis DSW-1]KGO05979.1 histidine kinase [Dokdonia donghaensis DSW-1]